MNIILEAITKLILSSFLGLCCLIIQCIWMHIEAFCKFHGKALSSLVDSVSSNLSCVGCSQVNISCLQGSAYLFSIWSLFNKNRKKGLLMLIVWSTVSRNTAQRFSLTPYITPRLTPTGTPKVISTSVSPRGYSVAGSPKRTSGTMSPTKTQNDGRISLSSWYPSSQQSSAANSPPRGRSLPGL